VTRKPHPTRPSGGRGGREPGCRITLDLSHPGPPISPLLFGHNLEHTRQSMWKGLAAELLANRKFAGEGLATDREGNPYPKNTPGPDGVAAHWFAIGGRAARFALDAAHPFAAGHSQRVTAASGRTGGIGQRGIPLRGGARYAVRLHLRADRKVRVTARVAGPPGRKACAEESLTLRPGGWREWAFSFKAPRADSTARLEITFEGPAALWLGAASLLPADHFHGMRRDVIELLKEISAPVLRWPGGNFTRDYRWREGLLPVDRRPPILSRYYHTLALSGNWDFHEVGIDEFVALCGEIGAEPAITINLDAAAAPPEDAAAWVEYCNGSPATKWGKVRAARGHRKPYGVKWWFVGNEIYGSWMGPAHSDAATYARRIGDYARAMKKADPSIALIASGTFWDGAGPWDETVLAHGGAHFDLLSEHHYAGEGTAHARRADPEDFARLSREPAGRVLDFLRVARERADRLAPPGRRIGLTFDEWNVWHDWFGSPFDHEWHVGPADAAHVASMLNMLCREAAALDLRMACFFEPVNEGCIAVDGRRARLTAAGQVFALYRPHQGGRLVPLEGPAPDSSIDACASLSRDRRRLHVTLVNRDAAGPQNVEIALAGAAARGKAAARLLAARDLRPDVPLAARSARVAVEKGTVLRLTVPRWGIALVTVPLGGAPAARR